MAEKPNHIVVTGPESTGKTELTTWLSGHLNCEWIPEYSRNYVETLNRPYTYEDVEFIARQQINQFSKAFLSEKQTIFDTGLIITKVWFDVVYKTCPEWLTDFLNRQPKMLHLLCDIDLPWIPDKVRENGGEMRTLLFNRYKKELEQFGFKYAIVSGIGETRNQSAMGILRAHNII